MPQCYLDYDDFEKLDSENFFLNSLFFRQIILFMMNFSKFY